MNLGIGLTSIWASSMMLGGGVGTRAVCASNNTTASCGARSGGAAGRRTWAGRRGTGFG